MLLGLTLMDLATLHHYCVLAELVAAALTALSLAFITAPYGRHERGGWGPTVPARVGWILMECPSVLLWLYFYQRGANAGQLAPLVLLLVWQLHYAHRTFVYPFRMSATAKRVPLAVAGMGAVFNTLNSFVNAVQVSHVGDYGDAWLRDPRFVVGVAVFLLGFVLNYRADAVLFSLRKPGETGYKIPKGALHDYVANPNYLGELLEWAGWTLATWSLAGLAFALYTAANLAPRAHANLQWYREKFPDYPRERKALIPFLW